MPKYKIVSHIKVILYEVMLIFSLFGVMCIHHHHILCPFWLAKSKKMSMTSLKHSMLKVWWNMTNIIAFC